MKIAIQGNPEFTWNPTAAHVAVLTKLSALHYDHLCKAAGRLGGFIYGWKNAVEFADGEPPNARATWSQLDICLKIMELPSILLDRAERELVSEMKFGFRKALNVGNQKYAEWKAQSE